MTAAVVSVLEAAGPEIVALIKQAVDAAGGPARAKAIIDAEYAATDAAVDAQEEARIAKESAP